MYFTNIAFHTLDAVGNILKVHYTRAQQKLRWATVATIDMGHKMGVAVPLSRGELGPRLKQCGLGRGLLPY